VRDHEGTAAALAAGEVTARQVESLAVAARQRGDAYAQHETTLLHAARTVEVQDFPRFTRRWCELAGAPDMFHPVSPELRQLLVAAEAVGVQIAELVDPFEHVRGGEREGADVT
jgi:hypothetical protein